MVFACRVSAVIVKLLSVIATLLRRVSAITSIAVFQIATNCYDTLPVLTQYYEFRFTDYSLKAADLEFDL